ncbi:MAG: GNAT family N-acetyltransferase [Christensenellaceae bacterium]|nr:GNAT family N-acetyltransferase [Christensenellaceae bacterium]
MLKVLGLNDEVLWRETVKSFARHDVYHLPEYTKAFRLHGDGEPQLIYYESGDTRAINVVMKRDIAGTGPFAGRLPESTYYDFATPYGYGGFLVEGDCSEAAMDRLNAAYTEYCLDSSVISEFVRFHPLLNNQDGLDPLYRIIPMGRTVTMDLSSPEVIRHNIRKSVRNRINKACRNNISVEMGWSPELLEQFYHLYTETMQRTNAQPYYFFSRAFFECVHDTLADNALIFYAVFEGQIIAMELVLYCNGKMHGHLQGSKGEYLYLCPIPLIVYIQALWGCENGYKELHLGGGVGASEDGVFESKKKFNENTTTRFYIGHRIFDQEKYDKLLSLRNELCQAELRPGFFPEYRA